MITEMEINKAKEGDWFVDSTGNRWDIVGQEGDCLLVNDLITPSRSRE